MYCPFCKEIKVCTTLHLSSVYKGDFNQRRYWDENHDDINFFVRLRKCQTCSKEFSTAEIEKKFIKELVQLRDSLSELELFKKKYFDLKKTVEDFLKKYKGNTQEQSKALSELADSLYDLPKLETD